MLKKLFSHSLIYGVGPQIGKFAGIVALPIITKDLTEADFGVWGIVLAYVGAFSALSNLGMSVVVSNSFFKNRNRHQWLWRQIYGFLHLWMIPFNLVVAAILWFIMPTEAVDNRVWIIVGLLLPGLVFGPTVVFGTYYYQLRQTPLPIAVRSAIFGVLTVVLNIWFISGLKLGYMGWLWSNFVVSMLLSASFWYPLNIKHKYTPIFNFKWRTIRKAFGIGIPTVPHQYSSYLLNSSDRIVLDQLHVGVADLGEFSLASRFGTYFQALVGAANSAIAPMMFGCYKNGKDEEARNLVFALQIAVLSATFLFSVWAREIFQFLIKNDQLAKVYPLAIIFVMAYNYRPMYIGAMNKVFYSEETGILWRVSFIGGVGNVILNLILVPIFGFEAAAYSTFACLMYIGFAGHFIKKFRALQCVSYYPLFWFCLIMLSTFAAYSLKDVGLPVKCGATVIILMALSVMSYKYRQWKQNTT